MKISPFLFIVLFIASSSSLAADANQRIKRVSYEELPRLVEERNENVEAASLHVAAQKERTGRLIRSFLPSLSAQLGGEEFKVGSNPSDRQNYWRIETSLNLYDGGRDRLEDTLRDSHLALAKAGQVGELQRELKEAKQAFWSAIAISKLIGEKKEALEKNETNLKSARRRAGAGISTTADAAQFEIHKVGLQREQRKLEHEYDVVLNRLSVAIALDEHENVELVGGFPEISALPPLKTFSSAERQLTVRTSRELQRAEDLRAQQSSRWWHPRLDAYASYGVPSLTDEYTRALRHENEWTAGLKLKIDLGQGFEARREAAAKNAESASLQRRAAHAAREAVAADHEHRHELSILTELIASADADVERGLKFLKLTESEYARGVKNGPDLLDAFRKYFEIRERRIENYRDYFQIKSELESMLASADSAVSTP